MFHPGIWPEWFHGLRLLGAFLLTAGFGIHAYYRHKQEAAEAVSPRKWMYWLYSVVFLGASAANFTKLCVVIVFSGCGRPSFQLGYSTLLLVLSYVALLVGVRRRSLE